MGRTRRSPGLRSKASRPTEYRRFHPALRTFADRPTPISRGYRPRERRRIRGVPVARRLLPGRRHHCHRSARALAVRSRRSGGMARRPRAGRGGQWCLRPLLHAVRGGVYAHADSATRLREGRRQGAWFVAGCMAARSLHEFGMLLALVPAAGWLCAETAEERRSFAWLLLVTTAALVAEHTLCCGFRASRGTARAQRGVSRPSGLPEHHQHGSAGGGFCHARGDCFCYCRCRGCRRSELSDDSGRPVFTIAAACAAALFANGAVAALVVLWSIARPSHAGKIVRAGLLASTAGSVAWIALIAIRSNVLVDARFVWGLLQGSSSFHGAAFSIW